MIRLTKSDSGNWTSDTAFNIDMHFVENSSFDPKLPLFQVEANSLLDSDQPISRYYAVCWSGQIRVKLVWTDPPGDWLRNDLDLVVTRKCIGFLLDSQEEVDLGDNQEDSARFPDRASNVENLVLKVDRGDGIVIKVRAYRMANSHEFALVWRVLNDPGMFDYVW